MRTLGRLSLWATPDSPVWHRRMLAGLLALTALELILTTAVGVGVLPPLALVLPLVIGGLVLRPMPLRLVLAAVAVCYLVEAVDLGLAVIRPGSIVVIVAVALIAVKLSADRDRLGLSIGTGETMLLDLSAQLRHQGDLPALPPGWSADIELRTAGASGFGGDFFVSSRRGSVLELAIVDVSGKGVDAGTRALLLSGALGGLLGSVPSERFLPAANDYLLRQRWAEGFATAMHLRLDLASGAFQVHNAGHPPALHLAGGSGRWRVLDAEGTVLGLVPEAGFGVVEGVLAPHDALLLYTDGVVEVPGRDLSDGIDRLLGAADRLLASGFRGGAAFLVDAMESARLSDDRALLLLRRL